MGIGVNECITGVVGRNIGSIRLGKKLFMMSLVASCCRVVPGFILALSCKYCSRKRLNRAAVV